jgi:hypothetical protein
MWTVVILTESVAQSLMVYKIIFAHFGVVMQPGVSQCKSITLEYLKLNGDKTTAIVNIMAQYSQGLLLPVKTCMATASVTISATFKA